MPLQVVEPCQGLRGVAGDAAHVPGALAYLDLDVICHAVNEVGRVGRAVLAGSMRCG